MHFGRSSLVNASAFRRYGIATSFLLMATLMRYGLTLIVTRPISSPMFLAAIILATWMGGLRLGIFTTIGASLTLDLFFAQPRVGTLTASDYVIRFILFAVEGSMISWLIEKLRLSSDALAESREELQELAEEQRTVRDEEQKRIAREIHDELGQELTSLKLGIHLLGRKIDKDNGSAPAVRSEVDALSAQVDATINSVRRIATELRPSILDDFGLVAAIEWQAKEFEKVSGLECSFNTNTLKVPVDPIAKTAIFRIFQEAMTNIVRHADASEVKVNIDESDGRVLLVVEDNGKGIGKGKGRRPRSLGILGMKERARMIGGEFSILNAEDRGTRVELLVPIGNESRSA